MSSSEHRMRRDLLRAALVALAATAAGCGFQLRGTATYPFDTVYVAAPVGAPFTAELKRALSGSGSAKLTESPEKAQVILDVTLIANDKAVLSLSPGGRVREFAIAKRVQFRLRDNEGHEWLPGDEIVVRRTYLYDDTERLAREIQEQRLDKDMQTDAIQQIVRRLQSAKKPA